MGSDFVPWQFENVDSLSLDPFSTLSHVTYETPYLLRFGSQSVVLHEITSENFDPVNH